MDYIKCSDYYIVKIYCIGDLKNIYKNKKDGAFTQKFYDRCRIHNDFLWELIHKISGANRDYWDNEFQLDARKCALNYIEEHTGILFYDVVEYTKILIPINKKWVLYWILDNVQTPCKQLKKTHLGAWNPYRLQTYFREFGVSHMFKVRSNPNITSTLSEYYQSKIPIIKEGRKNLIFGIDNSVKKLIEKYEREY